MDGVSARSRHAFQSGKTSGTGRTPCLPGQVPLRYRASRQAQSTNSLVTCVSGPSCCSLGRLNCRVPGIFCSTPRGPCFSSSSHHLCTMVTTVHGTVSHDPPHMPAMSRHLACVHALTMAHLRFVVRHMMLPGVCHHPRLAIRPRCLRFR